MKEQSKKILFISARSDMGGGPKHLHDLLHGIKNNFPNLTAYSASPLDPPFGEKFKKLSCKHVKIKARSFSLLSFFQLLNLCKKDNIEIIHSHGRGAGLYSRLLGLFNIKVIHTLHGAHNESGIIGKAKAFIDKLLCHLTDQFICVSPSEKEKALSLGFITADKTTIIPNGIDLDSIRPIKASDLRSQFNIPQQNKVWGTLTRLSPEKGNHLFLKEVAQNPGTYSNYTFLIAGDGPEKLALQEQASKIPGVNIHFLGQIENPISFLKGLDGFFSFSLGEGLPYAVLEAMACELPCVLSDVPGHKDFKSNTSLFRDGQFHRFISTEGKSALPKKYLLRKTTEAIASLLLAG